MTQEKRSLKNVTLTATHHWAYLGQWVVLSMGLLLLAYSVIIYHLFSLDMKSPVFGVSLITLATLLTAFASSLIMFLGLLTAHRIAGVHVQFKRTFLAIRDGDTEARLRFRAHDKLDDVAEAFNSMMDELLEGKKVPDS